MQTMNPATVISETKDCIEIVSPRKTDFFIDMSSGGEYANAPFCFERREGDFVMRARVRPNFASTYDAGALFVYDTYRKWIKLAFEQSDLGHPAVVSVVTDKVSDDANGERQDGRPELWLQVARRGNNWALHYSEDGRKWRMVRYFHLKMKAQVKIGLVAQSPLGQGCAVEFRAFKIFDNTLKDLRKGV